MIAFKRFNEIEKLSDIQQKHREWLKDYEEKKYSFGEDGHHKKDFKWTLSKYQDSLWCPSINLIGRLKNRTIIEFDDENASNIPKWTEQVKNKLQELKFGYILSTHKGKSNYIWVEFNRELKDKEVEQFLAWIAPEGSRIDMNFASSRKVFPCLFATHWKHSMYRELPIEFFEGEQIDVNKLFIPKEIFNISIGGNEQGQEYKTYQKEIYKKAISVFTDKINLAKQFLLIQPLYYDNAKMWWLWNSSKYCWELVDETDILNLINNNSTADTINSKERSEILEALKQVSRLNKPKEMKKTWIQFQNEVFDIKTGQIFPATSDYFVTNPIPYKLHPEKLESTPVMDKIFEEWVGKEHIQTLYEIIAYCLIPDYPISRLFCFVGGGMNGKSCFLNLLKKFIGDSNVCSTELDTLLSSRFEVTRLHKKLVCLMGETNFNELSRTSILKKLTGRDTIGFEYKNKNPFEDCNYAKIIIATNNLPSTTDKTIGFYRRWLVIDFPNQFSEKKDILEDIPEEEYESLGLKCMIILKDLLEKREFHKEGTIEQRIERYEAKSNFFEKFIKEFTTNEDVNGFITVNDFNKKFREWCKENRHRELSESSIGMQLKKLGFEQERKYFNWMSDGKGGYARTWLGIKWKE